MNHGSPKAEFEIHQTLVRDLLKEQHPDLMHLPLSEMDAGWDNVMFRLGDQLIIRMPRREASVQLILNEREWLPQIASYLPLPVPCPILAGVPGCGYPNHWNILPWLEGKPADISPPNVDQAIPFAHFLNTLHSITPPTNAPENLVRGVPLANRREGVEVRMKRLEATTNFMTPKIKSIWHAALEASHSTRTCWLHGDLYSQNVLVHEGAISGVIDWGDITAGDPATDLASIWMLFDCAEAHEDCLNEYAYLDESLLLRTRGWVVLFAVMLLDSGLVNNPRHASIGEATLTRLVRFYSVTKG